MNVDSPYVDIDLKKDRTTITIPDAADDAFEVYRRQPVFNAAANVTATRTDIELRDLLEGKSARIIHISNALLGIQPGTFGNDDYRAR